MLFIERCANRKIPHLFQVQSFDFHFQSLLNNQLKMANEPNLSDSFDRQENQLGFHGTLVQFYHRLFFALIYCLIHHMRSPKYLIYVFIMLSLDP